MADTGRPEFAPTAEQRAIVAGMAALGIRQDLICSRIINPATEAPIDAKTLRRAFRKELDGGMAEANQLVANALFEKAIGGGEGSVGAMAFWLKNRDPDNWKDRVEQVHSGAVRMIHEISDDDLAAIAAGSGD